MEFPYRPSGQHDIQRGCTHKLKDFSVLPTQAGGALRPVKPAWEDYIDNCDPSTPTPTPCIPWGPLPRPSKGTGCTDGGLVLPVKTFPLRAFQKRFLREAMQPHVLDGGAEYAARKREVLAGGGDTQAVS